MWNKVNAAVFFSTARTDWCWISMLQRIISCVCEDCTSTDWRKPFSAANLNIDRDLFCFQFLRCARINALIFYDILLRWLTLPLGVVFKIPNQTSQIFIFICYDAQTPNERESLGGDSMAQTLSETKLNCKLLHDIPLNDIYMYVSFFCFSNDILWNGSFFIVKLRWIYSVHSNVLPLPQLILSTGNGPKTSVYTTHTHTTPLAFT